MFTGHTPILLSALTLNVPIPGNKEKINLNFSFHTSLWCLRFYGGFKAFIKPFETPKRSVEIKISLNFFSSSGFGTGKVKI